jgi:prevent-host-death family protein
MRQVKIHEAKTNLSKLLAAVEAGEEIIIARGDKPIAKLVAAPSLEEIAQRRRNGFGALKGMFSEADLDEALRPLPDDIIDLMEGKNDPEW